MIRPRQGRSVTVLAVLASVVLMAVVVTRDAPVDDRASEDGGAGVDDGGVDDAGVGDGVADGGAADGGAADGGAADDGTERRDAREDLLARRVGYGREAADGATDWPTVTVTSLADDGPGSLRQALDTGERWVRFAPGLTGTILVHDTLEVPSDVVIDGRGADITVSADDELRSLGGATFLLFETENVIVTNLKLGASYDGIVIERGSRDVWIDHLTAVDADDEVVSIIGGDDPSDRPDAITISWVRFDGADKAILIGSSPTEPAQAPHRVTLHHNLFWRCNDRQPLVRFARVHAFNNWLYQWGADGTGQAMVVGSGAELLSEANVFDDVHERPGLVAEGLGERGLARSVDDLVTGATVIAERAPDEVFHPADDYDYEAAPADDALRATLLARAGWRPPAEVRAVTP